MKPIHHLNSALRRLVAPFFSFKSPGAPGRGTGGGGWLLATVGSLILLPVSAPCEVKPVVVVNTPYGRAAEALAQAQAALKAAQAAVTQAEAALAGTASQGKPDVSDIASDAEEASVPDPNIPQEAIDYAGEVAEQFNLEAMDEIRLQGDIAKQLMNVRDAVAKRTIAEERVKSGVELDHNEGSVLRTAVWGAHPRIPVYWENATAEQLQNECVWIREAIKRTWEKEADIQFLESKPLPQGAKGGIRIKFAEVRPYCKNLGKFIAGVKSGMVLNVTFGSSDYPCYKTVQQCIEMVAVHEFGHALGFAHENLRSDTPADCTAERQGSAGDYPVTVYDPRSVMNYCNPKWNNDGKLSKLDIEAARILFGDPP